MMSSTWALLALPPSFANLSTGSRQGLEDTRSYILTGTRLPRASSLPPPPAGFGGLMRGFRWPTFEGMVTIRSSVTTHLIQFAFDRLPALLQSPTERSGSHDS